MTIKDLFKELVVWFAILPMLIAWWVSATFTAHSIWAYTPSVWDSSFNVSVLALWDVNTENWSIDNFVFSPTNNLLFYRDVDSKPTLLLPNCYGNRYWWELIYYYFCDEIPDSNFNWMTNCSSFQAINDEYLAYFMGTITSNDNWAYDYHLWLYWFNLCFSSASEDRSICFGVQSSVYNNWCYVWQSDLTCSNWYCSYTSPFSWSEYTNLTYTFDNIPLEVVWFAPWSKNSDKPSYEIWEDKYTYWQIVEWYEACGLDVWYCYWWFPIDDIFEPNQSIEDFTWYKFWYGANIRYLYSLYSDTYTPKEFFQQMLQAYNNWQINRFKTEPKALIMFVQQYVSWKSRGLLNVWFYDLWDYCNIKLWYNDLNSIYTWHNQTPVACYKNKVTNEILQWWFQFTWDNAFTSIVGTWWSWYTNASDFFWNISSMFQNWIWTVNTNYSWIIPKYILLFMFALILLRIIQH